jgi:hypothetical protein
VVLHIIAFFFKIVCHLGREIPTWHYLREEECTAGFTFTTVWDILLALE